MFGNSVMLQCDKSKNPMLSGMLASEVKLAGGMLLPDRSRENKDLREIRRVSQLGSLCLEKKGRDA